MPDLAVSLNFMTIVLGVIGVLLLVWAVQAYQDAENARDAGTQFGYKVSRKTGGAVGFVSALLVGLIAGIYDAGMEMSNVLVQLSDLLVQSPQSFMGAGTALIGWLGLSGEIEIGANTYLGLAIFLLGAGFIIASRKKKRGRT